MSISLLSVDIYKDVGSKNNGHLPSLFIDGILTPETVRTSWLHRGPETIIQNTKLYATNKFPIDRPRFE